MPDLHNQVTALVDQFVAQISELARRAAMDTLSSALGQPGARGGRRAAAPAPAVGGSRRKGEKRPAAEIAATQERLGGFIASNPGLRIEEINRQLGTTTKDLALPLRKLIADGAVRSEGEKRSTRYFPGGGGRRGGKGRGKRRYAKKS